MNRQFCLPASLIVLAILAFTSRHTAYSWHSLFNGNDLTGWDSYLKGSGLNNDPGHVFTVVQDGKDKVIRVSGEDYGALYTFRADNRIGRHCFKAADAENPTGEWNTLDLYCHGDTSVHLVNGRVMMVLYHLGQVDQGQVRIEPISAIPAEILAK
jgi:Domain of Unknown Function (DUF1080)